MSNETTNKIGLVNLPDMPESVDNALKNLTDKPTANIGHTFGDIWYLVFGGISHAADKKRMKYAVDLEKYHQELAQAIDQIPEENKAEPSIQVTAQALENSKYCISEDELRKMFVNLISGTMDDRISHKVHPSFPEIIKQMSGTDALILASFKTVPSQPIANIILSFPNGVVRALDSRIYFDPKGGHTYPYVFSISSLERLGLLSVDFTRHLPDQSSYENFLKWGYFKHLQKEYEDRSQKKIVELEKGICRLTPLGQSFVDICIS